ncbi:MAG: L,D-transpeptidase family protein [Candidatus Aminicenantes bacterium]|nr:L,D-transpeptidase family protein [Candidatus Aminicenantes bacterium]MDH5705958.1 L,D-transpeptidase family protein [Candidatus Aminicenantes bacterium]
MRKPAAVFLLLSLSICACKAPPVPPEAKKAEQQEQSLWRDGAHVWAKEDFDSYRAIHVEAKRKLSKENAKFVWFRNYEQVSSTFNDVLKNGEELQEKVRKLKEIKSESIAAQLKDFERSITGFLRLTLFMNEGRPIRLILTKAELMLKEARLLYQREDLDKAEEKLESLSVSVKDVEDMILLVLDRYSDPVQVTKWRKWARDTILESRNKNIAVVIVSKIDRKLSLYKGGKLLSSYEIGLGHNGLDDKLYAADQATPEGRYRITDKLPSSNYYKALLIDYPNEEDKRKFDQARSQGHIPPGVRIGGLIEIHGGGKHSMTYGCISLENKDMDALFRLVEAGTPVTIVGAINDMNEILMMFKGKR